MVAADIISQMGSPYLLEAIRRERASRVVNVNREINEGSLYEFTKQAWHVLEPGTEFIDGWHLEMMAEFLEAVSLGQILRGIINVPPRYMKSIMTSVMWPDWTWTTQPEKRFMFLSHSYQLSEKHSVDRRELIESEWYQSNWGDVVKLSEDQNTKKEFVNSQRGHMTISSFGGKPLGKGGNIIVIDDPISPEDARSPAGRENALRFFRGSLTSRLDDKKKGAIVCVMQRLHTDDIANYMIEAGWTHLNLPCPAPQAKTYIFPLTKREVHVEEGEPLWEERENKADLAVRERDMGSVEFSAQYGQQPVPAGGLIFNPEWWVRYDDPVKAIKKQALRIVQFWDTAYKEKQANDYSVCATWAEMEDCYRIVDVWQGKLEFPDLQVKAKELRRQWAPRHIVIEPQASGISLVQSLRVAKLPVEEFKSPTGDKVVRANAVTGFIKAGVVEIPHEDAADWVGKFIVQHTNFPNVDHDDMVDTTSMALHWFELQELDDTRGEGMIEMGIAKDGRIRRVG